MTVIKLLRCVMRLPSDTVDRLDRFAEMASSALRCDVPRAAVIRAVLESWLDAADECDPVPIIEAIRAAMIKRGRKQRYREPSESGTVRG